jgi:hypothetical protein
MKILPPPTVPVSSVERKLQCEEELQDTCNALFDQAVAAGWGDEEVAEMLLSLAVARTLQSYEKDSTDRQISKAIGRIRGYDARAIHPTAAWAPTLDVPAWFDRPNRSRKAPASGKARTPRVWLGAARFRRSCRG